MSLKLLAANEYLKLLRGTTITHTLLNIDKQNISSVYKHFLNHFELNNSILFKQSILNYIDYINHEISINKQKILTECNNMLLKIEPCYKNNIIMYAYKYYDRFIIDGLSLSDKDLEYYNNNPIHEGHRHLFIDKLYLS